MPHLFIDASVWSADMTRFGEEMRRVDPYVDSYHFDVSDAHLVPGLLFFPDLVAALRPLTQKPFHIHLMSDNPLALIDAFAVAGAGRITVHYSPDISLSPALQKIRASGKAAGLGLSLEDPPDTVLPFLDQIDLVLMMGTPLGVKGIDLDPRACARISRLKTILSDAGFLGKIKIEADGGIRAHTVPQLYAAGADCIVPGSLVFKGEDLAATFSWLQSPHPPYEGG